MYIETHSSPEYGLGTRLPTDAAALIVASVATLDVMTGTPDLQSWMVGALIGKWGMDKLTNNAESVHLDTDILTYIKLTDGTFNTPPGVTSNLVSDGGLFRVDERFGRTVNFNAEKKVSSITDADGNQLTFTYSSGRLQQVADSFGHSFTLTYNGALLSSVSDSAGRSVSYGYTGNNLTSCTDPENKAWTYGYDGSHRILTLKNPLNITTVTNVYDAFGRVETQTVPRQTGSVTYGLYFSGYLNMEEDGAGNRTVYYYDDQKRLLTVIDALGNYTDKIYDGQNHVAAVTDPRGFTTTYQYDGDNNPVKTISPLSGTEHDTEYDYDSLFRKTDTHLSLNGVRQRHVSHLDYDANHHLLMTTTYPESGIEIYFSSTYYPNGLTNTQTDGRGILTALTYDGYGNTDTSQTAQEPAVDYGFNAIGQLASLTDRVGAVTNFEYDDRGLIKLKTDPLGKTTNYAYYDDGNLHTITDRNNDVTAYTYTPTGKMETITYQDASQVSFDYDLRDNLYQMHDGLGTTTYFPYDEANRLKSVTDPHGFTVSYEYDEAGNITEITYPGNKKVIYSYDELNRLKTVNINKYFISLMKKGWSCYFRPFYFYSILTPQPSRAISL